MRIGASLVVFGAALLLASPTGAAIFTVTKTTDSAAIRFRQGISPEAFP